MIITPQYDATPLLIQGKETWTGATVRAKVASLAKWLQQTARVQPGDAVAMVLGNQIETVPVLLAIRSLGAIPVPVNLLWPAEDMAYVLGHAEAVAVVTDAAFEQTVASALRHTEKAIPVCPLAQWRALPNDNTTPADDPAAAIATDPHALALLMYTSGTTAKPKGVMLSEANLQANFEGIAQAGIIADNDRLLMALPLFHCYGLTLTLFALSVGRPVVVEPSFRPRQLMDALINNQVTLLPLVPSMFRLLKEAFTRHPVGAMRVLSTLRCCISGGASLPPVVLEKMAAKGVTIIEGYGMTEAAPVVSVNRLQRGAVAGSVGLPLANVQVRVRTEDGQCHGPFAMPEEPPYTTPAGELELAGNNIMLGYLKNPAATKATLTADGWLKTGDLGHIEADGYVYLSHGRQKELVIKNGENIAPIRVEALILQNNAIAEVCVFGAPDDRTGERVVACVVPAKSVKPAAELEAIAEYRHWARASMPPLMQPDAWTVVTELPKNAVGKILRRQLQAGWCQQQAALLKNENSPNPPVVVE